MAALAGGCSEAEAAFADEGHMYKPKLIIERRRHPLSSIMPEGPECHILASRLDHILKNTYFLRLNIQGGRYNDHGPPRGWRGFNSACSSLTRIQEVGVKGKLLYWRFSNGYVMLNTLGMAGKWTHRKTKHCGISLDYARSVAHARNVRAGVAVPCKLWFKDQRHYGTLKFVEYANLGKKLASLGPDVLRKELSETEWNNLCKKYGSWTLPKLLMNQTKISGIGNYLKCEILYAAGLSPLVEISKFTVEELQHVYVAIMSIPAAALKARRRHRRRQMGGQDWTIEGRKFKLSVYNRRHDPKGHVVIRTKTTDNRTTHWVPEIQHHKIVPPRRIMKTRG